MTIGELRAWGQEKLLAAGIENAAGESLWLLEAAGSWNRTKILLDSSEEVPHKVEEVFRAMAGRRSRREPLQYILGEQAFCGLTFKVTPAVLIPRFETEELVEFLAGRLAGKPPGKLLEIGTGSGCIPIALLDRLPGWRGATVDISAEALEVAGENRDRHLAPGRLELLQGDCFSPVEEKDFDLIVSNPPYIEKDEIGRLSPEVAVYEPLGALDGGPDGLDFYRKLIGEGQTYLKEGGLIAFEIGWNQKMPVEKLLEAAGYASIETIKDLYGQDRIVWAMKAKP